MRWRLAGSRWGGRIASQVAARDAKDLAGLVLLGYPLHPPGQPKKLRTSHLSTIGVPTLIVQGSRDAFGTPEELQPFLGTLKAPVKLYPVEGGDHSFKVQKRSGLAQQEVYEAIYEQIVGWLRENIARRV
jgi:predicted alpha/beta-hydrolase family hydrolase